MFFFIPFSLIYLNKGAVSVRELTYRKSMAGAADSYYTIISKTYRNQYTSSWLVYDRPEVQKQQPDQIMTVYRRNNILFINNELFELNKPGFCRDGEDSEGTYRMCIKEVMPRLALSATLAADSVFVFEKAYKARGDSAVVYTYISAPLGLVVKTKRHAHGDHALETTELIGITEK
jgi:hypothetical protein